MKPPQGGGNPSRCSPVRETTGAARVLDPAEAESRTLAHRIPAWATALTAYLLLAVLLFLPAWMAPGRRAIGGGADPFLFTWFLRWSAYAVAHGLNPLFTTHLDYPEGVNLMWNTSIPLPSLLLAPLTLVAGPVVSYNLLLTLGLALSGWCAFLAFRRYVRSGLAAFVGGLAYGFSPFMTMQSGGHPHLTMAWAAPLALLLLDQALVRGRPSRWIGAGLGILGAAQLLTGEEVLAVLAVAVLVGLAVLGLMYRDDVRSRLRPALPMLAVAGVTFLVVAGLPLGMLFLGPQQVHGLLQPSNYYVSDLLGFLLPTRYQLIAPAAAIPLSDHFPAGSTSYVGVPMLALLVVLVRSQGRDPVMRWAAITAVVLAVLSLGNTLHVVGMDTRIPMPWFPLDHVPLVRHILPVRLALIVFLLVGLILSRFVDATMTSGGKRQRAQSLALVAVGLLAWCPTLPYPTSSVAVPRFFSQPAGLHALPEGSVVLVAPFAALGSAEAMYWQATAGMWFRMPEGYVFVPSPYPLSPPPSATELALVRIAMGADIATPPDLAQVRDIRLELQRWDVQAVVVGPMSRHDAAVSLMSAVLGRPPVAEDGVDVWWTVPDMLRQVDRQS